VAAVKAVESLHNLILGGKLLSCMMHVVYVIAVRNASVGGMRVIHVDYNGMVQFDLIAGIASFPS
jgi:glucose uptake protein GlcU